MIEVTIRPDARLETALSQLKDIGNMERNAEMQAERDNPAGRIPLTGNEYSENDPGNFR